MAYLNAIPMKTAAAMSQVNQPKENGLDLNFLILSTQSRAKSENRIIMDSRRMNLDWASRAVSGRNKHANLRYIKMNNYLLLKPLLINYIRTLAFKTESLFS